MLNFDGGYMTDSSFEASQGGDAVWVQHLLWIVGHPGFWLTIFMWLMFFIGMIKLGLGIWRTGKSLWLVVYILFILIALGSYAWLSINAFDYYTQGRGAELIALKWAKLLVLLLSILSLGWIVKDLLKVRENK